MKKLMAMILTLAMVMSLCVAPASAADGKVTITITPDKSSVDTATGDAIVTYTVKAKVNDPTLKVGALTITLDPSAGLTLAEKTKKTDSAFYYDKNTKLIYLEGVFDDGIFTNFDYASGTKTFVAAGATSTRSLNNSTGEVVLMTIMGKIAQGTTGTVTLGTTTCTYGDVMAEASHDCDVTPATVTITKAPITSVTASVDTPVKGQPLDFNGTVDASAPYSITEVEWFEGTDASGKSVTAPATAKAEQFYYARITLTAKSGETFAESLDNTISGDYSVTRVNDTVLTLTKAYPKTSAATLSGIDIITNPALELAVPTAAPNATATNERSLAVTGVYDDGSGGPVAVNWEITTTPIPKGVSLDGSTLKVTNEAEAGTFRVKATSTEGYTDAETVTITKDTPAATHIVATAPATTNITIPNGGTNTSGNCSYKVYDQYGAEMTGISATWKMKLEPATVTGVTLIPANGSISVTNAATTCTATLYAESGGLKSNEITFNITREESKPYLVTITGADSMNVPIVHAPGADGWNHETYTAEVKDQYNNVISNPGVEWSVTGATGVSIDNTTGKLTVSNKAKAGPVTITAKSGDASGNKTVTINKDVAKATLVEICDQAGEGPETSLLIPTGTGTNNVDYTAKVYDQYGVYMPGEMVHWALDPLTVTGVELDDTTVSGSATLKVGNTATSGTTFKLKANTATPGTSGVKELDITLTSKTPASVTTAPEAVANLEYNGNEQALVTEGTASGGTMQYSLDGSNWTDTVVPKGKDAKTYTVYYKVKGDSDHADYTPASNTVSVSIAQKEVTVAAGTYKVSKEYDTTTTAGTGNGVLSVTGIVDSGVSVKATPVAYTDANVGGQSTMDVTITLDGTGKGNYKIKDGATTISVPCKITAKEVTLTGGINATDRSYVKDNKTVDLTKGTLIFTGLEGSETLDVNIPATGTISDADAGNGKTVTYSGVTLADGTGKASNYTLNATLPTVTVNIIKAAAPAPLADIPVSQKYTVTTGEKAIGAVMPADAGTLTYTKGTASKTGSVTVTSWAVDTTGKVTYTLSSGAAGNTVTLPVTIESTNYENATVNVVITLTKPSYSGGGGSYTPSYTVSVDKTENGTITVSPKSASKGDTVTITVKPDKGYELEMLKALDKDGDALKLTEKNGKYTFKMPSGKVTVKGSFVEEAPVQIFKDVPVDAYYYEAVKWAAEKGITGGVGNKLFAPNQPCTRAQIVTFLWRAAGSPAPKNMSSFADVPADAFYAKAVAWAVENGITGGTGDGKFSPDATCTRAQSVTFLYRAAGSPKVSGSAEFGDVATNAYYADAVAWAAKNGITGGIGGGLFGSGNDCTRGQIVTFLYRSVK